MRKKQTECLSTQKSKRQWTPGVIDNHTGLATRNKTVCVLVLVFNLVAKQLYMSIPVACEIMAKSYR